MSLSQQELDEMERDWELSRLYKELDQARKERNQYEEYANNLRNKVQVLEEALAYMKRNP